MRSMKNFKVYSLLALLTVGIVTACKDDTKELVPDWESGVHGQASWVAGSPTNFVFGDQSKALDFNLKWVSIDQENVVTKIDVYVLFDEPFIDPDGNPVIAKHGGNGGKLYASFSGAAVPANRTNLKINITQDAVYQLYKDASFDYDKNEATTPTKVFTNPDVPDRTASNPFVKGDAFTVKWTFTTEDGRTFSTWGVSVCTEYPGANCQWAWGVICDSDLAGTYDVVSEFVSEDYGFSSASPDYTQCASPGNDGSIGGGFQTYNDVEVEAGDAAATYIIPDLTNGFEPMFWCNPPVKVVVADQCGSIVLISQDFDPYPYSIMPGSKVNPDGSLTIIWQNPYNEHGVSTYTPN